MLEHAEELAPARTCSEGDHRGQGCDKVQGITVMKVSEGKQCCSKVQWNRTAKVCGDTVMANCTGDMAVVMCVRVTAEARLMGTQPRRGVCKGRGHGDAPGDTATAQAAHEGYRCHDARRKEITVRCMSSMAMARGPAARCTEGTMGHTRWDTCQVDTETALAKAQPPSPSPSSRHDSPWGPARSSAAGCGSSGPPGGRAPCGPARSSSRGGWRRCGP